MRTLRLARIASTISLIAGCFATAFSTTTALSAERHVEWSDIHSSALFQYGAAFGIPMTHVLSDLLAFRQSYPDAPDGDIPFQKIISKASADIPPDQLHHLSELIDRRLRILKSNYAVRRPQLIAIVGSDLTSVDDIHIELVNDQRPWANIGSAGDIKLDVSVLIAAYHFTSVPAFLVADLTEAGSLVDDNGKLAGAIVDTPAWAYFSKLLDFAASDPGSAERVSAIRDEHGKPNVSVVQLIAANFDAMFNEQLDFLLAHEMGHHALGHFRRTVAFADCEQWQDIERQADAFGLLVSRPAGGIALGSGFFGILDLMFGGGLQQFLIQTWGGAYFGPQTLQGNCDVYDFATRLEALARLESRLQLEKELQEEIEDEMGE